MIKFYIASLSLIGVNWQVGACERTHSFASGCKFGFVSLGIHSPSRAPNLILTLLFIIITNKAPRGIDVEGYFTAKLWHHDWVECKSFLVFVCIPSFVKVSHNYLSQSPLSTLISCSPEDSWKGFVNHRGKHRALWWRPDCWLIHHYCSPGSCLLLCISLFHIRGYTLFIYDFINYGTESKWSISTLVCFKTLRKLITLCARGPPWPSVNSFAWDDLMTQLTETGVNRGLREAQGVADRTTFAQPYENKCRAK